MTFICGFIGYICSEHSEVNIEIEQKINEFISVATPRNSAKAGFFGDDYFRSVFCQGNQLSTFENERYWICLNGKIVNHNELRQKLSENKKGISTKTVTETILALYCELKEDVINNLRGSFGLIIWDKHEQIVFGARDPFGIKPFLYLAHKDRIYFSSEKRYILLAEDGELDMSAMQHYFSFQYVPEPYTITKEIKKLLPGHYFTKRIGQEMIIKSYWKPTFRPINSSESLIINDIRKVLTDSVHVHMESNNAVGAYLSGGIDSTIIVSLAKQLNPNILSFTAGFDVTGFNEVNIARQTADELHLENNNYIISPAEFLSELSSIVLHLDDPLADPSAIPLYFVAREAKKHVDIVLSGEGADELFGGYNIYLEPTSLKVFNYIPNQFKVFLKTLSGIMPDGMRGKSFIERGTTPLEERYIGNARIFNETEKRLLLQSYNSSITYRNITCPIYKESHDYDAVTRMQDIDIQTWLRGDILVKADRMSKAHSLELRFPFLDKKVFDLASTLSADGKVRRNTTKYLLRKAMEGIVPNHVVNRKKLGFPVPIRHWLKDEIYDWAFQLIHTSEIDYILNKKYVFKLLEEHVMNKKDNSRKLWSILIFMLWHQLYIEDPSSDLISKSVK